MVNDTNTLNGALTELGETMADNLVSMGVTGADASDGLTTLAGKILLIEPSIGGLDLDTAITLSASSTSIISGQSVVLTSKLTASYDDETIVDVDLTGVLTGATVLFEDLNGVVVGSGVTDSTGYATATVSNLAVGSHTIKAIFEGTDNFHYADSTTVNITVTAQSFDGITINNSNDVISYNNNVNPESTTITAQLTDSGSAVSVGGETVTFKIKQGDTVIETLSDTTDNTGKASVSYEANGIGDCSIVCECNLLTETYATTLQDCLDYQPMIDNSHQSRWDIPSNVSSSSSFGYDSNGWNIGNPISYSSIYYHDTIQTPCSVEFTLTDVNHSQAPSPIVRICNSSKTQIFTWYNGNNPNTIMFGSTNLNRSVKVNSVYKLVISSSTIKLFEDGVEIGSTSITAPSTIYYCMDTGNARYTKLKDFKIKPL